MAIMLVKNTFLELLPITEDNMRPRSRSCPTNRLKTDCAAKKLIWTEPPFVRNEELNADEDRELQTLWPTRPCNGTTDSFSIGVFAPPDPLGSSSEPSIDEPTSDQQSQATKRNRPCKGKRHRHKKLVHRLQMQILENPEDFTMDDVVLPPSLLANEEQRLKLIGRMKLYQHEVLTPQCG